MDDPSNNDANITMARLGSRILVGSGAMGTVLRQGQELSGEPVELLNLRRPEAVLDLHRAYRAAGSQILVTNTFAANPLTLAECGVDALCGEINAAGVALARQAAGDACLVWASVGPLSLGLRHEDFPDDQLDEIYASQCASLVGADAIVLETFTDPRESRAALKAAAATGLPFAFQVGHTGRGRNRWTTIDLLLAQAESAGAAAVGANCQHPDDIVDVAAYLLSKTRLPVTASPNAGNPAIERGLVRYELTPADFSGIAERLATLGVSVIGGCCGTSPDHIREIAPLIEGRPVGPLARVEVREAVVAESRPARPAARNAIRELIGGDRFLISVEIRADRTCSLDDLCRNAEGIARAGADLFDVPDNPGATVGRDAVITAARLQDVLRVPSICHKAVTQSNLLQLHSGLIGAWDIGLRGILAVTGDPPSMGPLGSLAERVTDLKSSVELLRLIRKLRAGELINGDRIADPPDFCAGATIGWPAPAQIAWLKKKIAAGAEYIFSQPLFSVEAFRELQDAAGQLGARLFPGLLPLTSRRNAEFFASGRIPGIRVPESVVAALARHESAGDQRKAGLELALGLAGTMAAEARGIYLIMPFGGSSHEDTARIVRHLRALRPAENKGG
ncbi:MAG: homocysteine S-methyltransferase family protein [Deltaproteobacteria bacterium]|nr:homocysteine S-methyltransferase family protein [Deltaproteobacteria bacterium]